MSRLMSVTLTEQAVVERRKTVTRRLGWHHLIPGTRLDLCRKVMGRRRRDGTVEPLVRLAHVEVVSVTPEPLCAIDGPEVYREGLSWVELGDYARANAAHVGYPADRQLAEAFVTFFIDSMRCTPTTVVNRIEWAYLPDPPSWSDPTLL